MGCIKCPRCDGTGLVEDRITNVYNICDRCGGKGECPDDERAIRENVSKLLSECAAKLAEHCQSVRIFVTFPLDDGTPDTAGMTEGSGNLYAQIGQVREWIITQDEYVKLHARKEDEE